MCRFFLDPVFRLIDLFTLIPSHSVMTPIASQKLLKSCKVRSSKFVFLDQNCFGCFRFLALPHIFYNCHFPQKSNLTFTGIALDVFQGICPINLSCQVFWYDAYQYKVVLNNHLLSLKLLSSTVLVASHKYRNVGFIFIPFKILSKLFFISSLTMDYFLKELSLQILEYFFR